MFSAFYSFWDGQVDDLRLCRRVAESAKKLGCGFTESCRATSIQENNEGWIVDIADHSGKSKKISALYVVNALGPWANRFLEASNISPRYKGFNNKGIHLVFPDLGLKSALFLQSPTDDRIFFVIPWLGHTLVGTTESIYDGDPDRTEATDQDIWYLLKNCNRYLSTKLEESQIQTTFAGLRWLPVENAQSISSTSRAATLGEHQSSRGFLITIYGGKYTTYRSLAEIIGNSIVSHFGERKESQTSRPESWVIAKSNESELLMENPLDRFATQAIPNFEKNKAWRS